MHIAIYTSSNKDLVLSMIDALKKRYTQLKFVLQNMEGRGWQIQLLGASLEDAPVSFADGFYTAWHMLEKQNKQLEEKEKTT